MYALYGMSLDVCECVCACVIPDRSVSLCVTFSVSYCVSPYVSFKWDMISVIDLLHSLLVCVCLYVHVSLHVVWV